jgi:acetyl esterase/lipase
MCARLQPLLTGRRALLCAVALGVLNLPACRVGEVRLWSPPPTPGPAFEVERVRDVAFYQGPDADPVRHRLDLFLPKGARDCPVVVLVHGGAWVIGNNRCSGLYTSVGEFLAGQGVVAALPNYRLSPAVKHPEHVKDVARAVAWVHRHVAARGGRPDLLFLAGHSAGGHLVSLLATDEQYLKAEGLSSADVKGVISLSGVYDLPEGSLPVTLGGSSVRSFRFDELMPLRGVWSNSWPSLEGLGGIPLWVDVFGPAFGDDAKVRKQASPRRHIHPGLPPFLILCAEKDLPHLTGMAKVFHQALRKQGCDARLAIIPGCNHNSIVFRAVQTENPAAKAMLEFICDRSGAPGEPAAPPKESEGPTTR